MNEPQFDALPPVDVPQTGSSDPTPGAASAAQLSATPSVGQVPQSPMVDPAATPSPAPAAAPATPVPALDSGHPLSVPLAGSTPSMADDVDLIEKEWVSKAKQIVEHTKHDPYEQNKAMTAMKNDYLKKRYNREIKVSES